MDDFQVPRVSTKQTNVLWTMMESLRIFFPDHCACPYTFLAFSIRYTLPIWKSKTAFWPIRYTYLNFITYIYLSFYVTSCPSDTWLFAYADGMSIMTTWPLLTAAASYANGTCTSKLQQPPPRAQSVPDVHKIVITKCVLTCWSTHAREFNFSIVDQSAAVSRAEPVLKYINI